MRTMLRAGAVVLAIAGAIWGWRVLFPSEEARVRGRLDAMAEAATFSAGENPLIRLSKAAALSRYFAVNVRLDAGGRYGPIVGRDALMVLAARAQPPAGELRVELVDVAVAILPDGASATAHLTAMIHGRNRQDGSPTIDARELDLALTKLDDEWMIARVTPVETIERP